MTVVVIKYRKESELFKGRNSPGFHIDQFSRAEDTARRSFLRVSLSSEAKKHNISKKTKSHKKVHQLNFRILCLSVCV